MKLKYLLVAAAALPILTPTVASADIVNIVAVNPVDANVAPAPVTQSFAAGTYNAQVIGTAQGGLYDAWGVATPSAGNYENRYNISYNGNTIAVNPLNGQRFQTVLDSLSAVASNITSFTLDTATDVTFSIPDFIWSDNVGGVSVNVTPASPTSVPEPGMLGLFSVGLVALAMRKRRSASTAA